MSAVNILNSATTLCRFWLFMLSPKKTNCNPLAHPTWKCHHTNLWIAKLFHLTEGLLHSFKRWRLWREPVVGCRCWLWKEPVVMCVNWSVRQATSQQVFRVQHGDMCLHAVSNLFEAAAAVPRGVSHSGSPGWDVILRSGIGQSAVSLATSRPVGCHRVATNLEYAGISLNMENSGEFCATSGKYCNKVVLVHHSNICCVKQRFTG